MTSFAAIIGHADESGILDACIRHHIGIGVERLFVCLQDEDEATATRLRGDERIMARPVSDFASDDPFLYFSEALRVVRTWAAPDWVLFADSDEFWIPESGTLGRTAGLGETDVFITERFNAPPLRDSDGIVQAPDLREPAWLPVVAARQFLDDDYLSGDPHTPWIMAQDAPKLMVRPQLVERVATGAHSIVAREPGLRWRLPGDLMILHTPFTTEERFRRKVAAIRAIFARHGARFNLRQAWHWRHWMALAEDELPIEFERQSFRASAVPALMRQDVLASPQQIFRSLRESARELQGDALHEALERAIANYRRPGAPSCQPKPAPAPAGAAPPLTYAPERQVSDPKNCIFYHSMAIPDFGEVTGQWDLRGEESAYLGGVSLRGRSVLEIGPASGYLSFWMERQGAEVTSFDLDEHHAWDIVPYAGLDRQAMIASRKETVRRINNAWWFTRSRLGARARAIYGTIYDLDRLDRSFDLVTVNSVLLHLRDPLLGLANAAAHAREQIVVTDVISWHPDLTPPAENELAMRFIPRAAGQPTPDTWWQLSKGLVAEFLRILGFRAVELTDHVHRFVPDGQEWRFYTVVGTR